MIFIFLINFKTVTMALETRHQIALPRCCPKNNRKHRLDLLLAVSDEAIDTAINWSRFISVEPVRATAKNAGERIVSRAIRLASMA